VKKQDPAGKRTPDQHYKEVSHADFDAARRRITHGR